MSHEEFIDESSMGLGERRREEPPEMSPGVLNVAAQEGEGNMQLRAHGAGG